MLKNVNDFKNHYSVFEQDLSTVDTNCLIQAVNRRYSDFIECEFTNQYCIRNGEPMELEAEAYEAKDDVKFGIAELLRRKNLETVLASFVFNNREGEIHHLFAISSFFHQDKLIAVLKEAKEIASRMDHDSQNGWVPNNWVYPEADWEDADCDDDYDDGYDEDDDDYDDGYDEDDDDYDDYDDYDDDDWDEYDEVNKEQENDDGVYK